MTVLHVRMCAKKGKGGELEKVYRSEFVPAIRRRRGFRQVRLLKRRGRTGEYELDIVFTSEALRLEWVNSPEHAKVWPRMANLCRALSRVGFDVCSTVEKTES